MRHFHGDRDDVNVGAVHEVLGVIERERHSEAPAGGLGGFAPAGGQRRDLEVIRERLQGRDVRLRRPAAIRVSTDDGDANSLGHDALLNMQRAIFQPPPPGPRAKMKSSRFASGPLAPVATTVAVPAEWVRAYATSPFTVSSSTVKWIAIRMFAKTASYAPRTADLPDAVGKPAGMNTPSSA